MSYLWLWISILYAAMQINNQSAVSRAFFNCLSVCSNVLSICVFLTSEMLVFFVLFFFSFFFFPE